MMSSLNRIRQGWQPRLPLPTTILVVLVVLHGGCTAAGGVREDAALGGGPGTLAVVQLERWGEGAQAASHLLSDAKVARYRGIDGRGVERLLGGHGLDVETCGQADALPADLGAHELAVELLDVGTIDVQAGEQSLVLTPRVFPAVAGAAHGVFYVADTHSPQPSAEMDEYVVAAPGAAGVGAFEVALAAPSAVEDLVVGGQSLYGPPSPLEVDGQKDVEVSWAALDPRDRVELEWAAGGRVLTCVARDDGHFVVPAELLGAMPQDDAAQLIVRRVRLAPFDMQGIEIAYVRAVAATVQPVRLR